MTRRFLLALPAALLAALAGAAVLGLFNVLPHQLAYAIGGLALAAAFFRMPALLRALLARIAPDAGAAALSLGAGGIAAMATLLGLGAFALVSAAINGHWVDAVWSAWFPIAPLAGALAGLLRYGYLELLRWMAAEAREDDA